MLWGCQTVEEHYDTIRTHLALAKQNTGEAGLAALGFQFRMAHHPERCSCDNLPMVEMPSPATNSSSTTSSGRACQDEESSSTCSAFFVPTGTPISLSQRNEASWSDHPAAATEETLSSNPFHINTVTTPTATTTSASASRHFSRVASTVSMFSLATHHTYTSNADSFLEYDNDDDEDNILCCLRLFHVESNTMITAKNHETFIAHGLHYDEIARLAMEYAQQVMLQEGGLEWYTTPSGSTLLQTPRNTASSDKKSKNHAPPPRNVLLVITGKGLVRAGIFSRRHILTTGIESATALPFLRQAQKRNMDTILLDPNAHGWKKGMQTVQDSLNELFGPNRTSNDNEQQQQQHVYVLAHSMAGAQLVRYLKQQNDDSNDEDDQCLLRKIKAIAFTDSNHNINWTKDNPQVTDVLVGPASLYIKSHKVHEDAKALGEAHHDCDFWKHRFGTIRTLWAGTSEHALTNYTGRFPIWEHFDARMKEQQQEKHDENG